MKKLINKINSKATELAIRTKTALASKSGEGYIDTAVKIIIGVVVGGVIAFLYNIGEERQGTHMKKNYESVYRMKLTGYQVRTAIGILNERRLALKSQGCTLENSEEYVGVFNLLSRFLDLLPA